MLDPDMNNPETMGSSLSNTGSASEEPEYLRNLRLEIRLLEANLDGNISDVLSTLSPKEMKKSIVAATEEGLIKVFIYLIDHRVDLLLHYNDDEQNNILHLVLRRYASAYWSCIEDFDSDFDSHTRFYPEREDELSQCATKLVEAGVDVNHLNKDKQTPIMIAARKGLYKVVIYLINHYVDLPLQVDITGNNLLHLVLQGYIKHLENYGCANETRDDLLQCVMQLVKAGVDVNHRNQDKLTPIMVAATSGLYEVVIYLMDCGVDLALQYIDNRQNNLLQLVLYGYNSERNTSGNRDQLLQCVKKLVQTGVDVNHLGIRRPLELATILGLYKVAIYLIEHGAHVHYVDVNLQSPLHFISDHPSYVYGVDYNADTDDVLNCVIKLVEYGADVNHLNGDLQTPVFIAARNMLYRVVKYLLDNGAHVHYVDCFGRNILHLVLYNIYKWGNDINKDDILYTDNIGFERGFPNNIGVGDIGIDNLDHYSDECIQVVDTLINMGVDVNEPDRRGNTPVFYIVRNMFLTYFRELTESIRLQKVFKLQYNLISKLVNAGCNMHHQNHTGKTPLMHYTRHQADISILKLAILHSDANLTDNNGDTACSYFVKYRVLSSTIILKFCSHGVLMSPNNGVKLFHEILSCKRLELFNYYMRLKLIVNGVTTEGENMLHLLASVNYDYSLDKFNWLFNTGLDINRPCFKTNTPIMVAALLLNSKYLELFTRHPRIDINAQNNQGHTALHLCIIGFTLVKDGLNNRQEHDVVENYCRRVYPIYMDCVDILLAVVGVDVNTQDGGGRTALMMAAIKNDRFLIMKLLKAGAIVYCNGKSALHHLDIYESVFDLSFKLLVSALDNRLLNLPCINGSTLIQETLRFPRCWDPHTAVSFIKYLVGENCCLQSLVTTSVENSYNQIDMRELSSQERDKLRKLLYLSGAPEKEVVATLNFEKEDQNVERNEKRRLFYLRGEQEEEELQYLNLQSEDKADSVDRFHSRHQEIFNNYCCNISLESQCRRIIRQKLGLGIKEKVLDLKLPRRLNDFLLLKDILHPIEYNMFKIDDGCEEFYDDDGYDIDNDRDVEYSQNNYQYFTLLTDGELLIMGD